MGCGCKDAQEEPIKLNRDHRTPVEPAMQDNKLSAVLAERDVWRTSYEQLQKDYEEATKKFDAIVDSLPRELQQEIVNNFFGEDTQRVENPYKIFRFTVELKLEADTNDLDTCTLLDDVEIGFKQNGYIAHGFAMGDAYIENSTREHVVLSNPDYVDSEQLF